MLVGSVCTDRDVRLEFGRDTTGLYCLPSALNIPVHPIVVSELRMLTPPSELRSSPNSAFLSMHN